MLLGIAYQLLSQSRYNKDSSCFSFTVNHRFTALCGFTTLLNGNGVAYFVDEETGSSAVERLHCSGFSDAAYDAIMNRALAEKDLEKRAAILHEAEEYLISKMPIAPVLYNQLYYVVEEIRGLDFDGYGAPVFTKAGLT